MFFLWDVYVYHSEAKWKIKWKIKSVLPPIHLETVSIESFYSIRVHGNLKLTGSGFIMDDCF